MRFHWVPYIIFGVKLHAVENDSGWIERYCNTKQDCLDKCEELNNARRVKVC